MIHARGTRIARALALLCLWVGARMIASAEGPSVHSLFPAGGAIGSSFTVTAEGSAEPWPCRLWTPECGLRFTADPENEGEWKVEIAPDCPPGVHLLRAVNAEGAARPAMFVVTRAAELREEEPNNALDEAQPVEWDGVETVLNGRWDRRDDVDRYFLRLKEDEAVEVGCVAWQLDSPVDPLLTVRDRRGVPMAFNHDAPGPTLDPALTFRPPANGEYIFEVAAFAHPPQANHRFTGGQDCVYRLTFREPDSSASPDSTPGQAMPFAVPFETAGCIGQPGAESRVMWEAAKGDSLHIEVTAAECGSPLDGVLELRDGRGNSIEIVDDTGKKDPDPALDWVVPEDGRYEAVVRSRYRSHGGPEHRFRIRVSHNHPDYRATALGHSWLLKPGESVEIGAKVERKHGHRGRLQLVVRGLPTGLTAEPAEVSPEEGEVKATVRAADDAEPAGTPIRLEIVESDGTRRPVPWPIQWGFCDPGRALVNDTSDLWLNVAAK